MPFVVVEVRSECARECVEARVREEGVCAVGRRGGVEDRAGWKKDMAVRDQPTNKPRARLSAVGAYVNYPLFVSVNPVGCFIIL